MSDNEPPELIDREAAERRAYLRALREPAPPNHTTIRMRAETSRRCFEDMLEYFVREYAPSSTDPRRRDCFQRDLMMLFHDAMRHQAGTFGLHIERTESTLDALSMHATSALQAIHRNEKYDQKMSVMDVLRRQMQNQPKKED